MLSVKGIIAGADNRPMLYDVTYSDEILNKALIVFLHGFKGFKDWGHFPLLAATFAKEGFPFLKFNFSHNGTTVDHPLDFADTEAFGRNTISKELEDIQYIIHAIHSTLLLPDTCKQLPIIFLAHSRGGGIALLHAAKDARIKGVITLASLSKYGNFFGDKRYQEWQQNGIMYVVNSRTGQQLPMYWSYMEDLECNAERLDILTHAHLIRVPTLIVHGTNDESVPVYHANRLHEAIAGSELLLIDGANHTFGGKHPYLEPFLPPHTTLWTGKAMEFIQSYIVL